MSVPKILILASPDDQVRLRELCDQQLRHRWRTIDIACIGGTTGLQTVDPIASGRTADAILVVERAIAADPEDRYARELGRIFVALPPEARARCISCSLGAHSDSNLIVRVGPHRHSLGDLGDSDNLDTLDTLIQQKFALAPTSAGFDATAQMLCDRPVEVDRVGFAPAVETLASFLAAPELQPPLVVSVEGGWGVGKSSFLLQLRKELRSKYSRSTTPANSDPARPSRDPAKIRTVWVNTWSSDESSAYSSFALALIAELSQVGPLRAVLYRIHLALLRFDWSTGWKDFVRMVGGFLFLFVAVAILIWGLPAAVEEKLRTTVQWVNAGALALIAVFGVEGIRQLRSFFGSPFGVDLRRHLRTPDYEAARSLGERHFDDVARIIDAYSGNAERIFVFVDDLDRSDPAKVAEVTQTINLILASTSKQLIYILAIDREKVAAAIAARSKDIASLVATANGTGAQPIDFGHLFLEKLIQVPFRVPTISSKLLATWIDPRSAERRTQLQQAIELVAPYLRENPRRIKQFVNLLHLRVRLLNCQLEANAQPPSLLQLGKFITAEMLYPAFIQDVAAAPHLLQTLLLGTGEGRETTSYRRWSSHTDLLDLLTAAPNAGTRVDKILAERHASLLGLDLSPILRLVARERVDAGHESGTPVLAEDPLEALRRYAAEYERVRQTMPFGGARTNKLDRLFHDMTSIHGVSQKQAAAMFATGEPGLRVAALAAAEATRASWVDTLLIQVVQLPLSRFEEFHALRLAISLWARLPEPSRRVLAQLACLRRVRQENKKSDPPIWKLTERLVGLCGGLPLADEITVDIPDRGTLRLPVSALPTFSELVDFVYGEIQDRARIFHYGTDWWLALQGERLTHRRELEGRSPGNAVLDNRPIAELGIVAGSSLTAVFRED